MSDFTRGSGPLSALARQPKTRFETDPMASYQSPTLAAEAAEAEPEDSGTAGLYRKARETLMASQSTGMDPLTTFLLAASQAGPGGIGAAIGRGGIAAQQAMVEGEKSEQERQLKLLTLGIEEGKYKEEAADRKTKAAQQLAEKNKPELKQIFDEETGREVMAWVYSPSSGIPPIIVGGVKSEKPESPEKPVGFNSRFEPTSNFFEVAYNNGAEVKKAKENARNSLEVLNMSERVYNEVEKNPGAFTALVGIEKMLPDWGQAILREQGLSQLSAEEDVARNKVFTEAAAIMVKMYGVAQSKGEGERAKQWLPAVGDSYQQLQTKLRSALEYAAEQSDQIPDEVYGNLGFKEDSVKRFYDNRQKIMSGELFKKPPPQMTGDDSKDKATWGSLNPGDSYIDINGQPRTK